MMYQHLLGQSELLLRILTACICGSVIGYERKNRNKVAGIRTHAIVALGSALIMIVSKYGFTDMPNPDGSRVAAQIVSGIGFLGAGIIFVRNNSISGLTTAAGVWATSGIGMAIGSGLYYIGIATTILIIIVQVLMHLDFFKSREHKYETIIFTLKDGFEGFDQIRLKFRENSIEIASIEMKQRKRDEVIVEALLVLPPEYDKAQLVDMIGTSKGVISTKC